MTKITFKHLADKYDVFEEDIERIFACYDTNDMTGMRSAIRYCFFCGGPQYNQVEFLFDIIRYIHQCQNEQTIKEEEIMQEKPSEIEQNKRSDET